MMKLASFDIFDTTLIRKCGQPENVFYLLAHRLYPDDEACQLAFVRWRIKAGEIAVKTKNVIDANLWDMYELLPSHFLGKYSRLDIMQKEISLESEMLVANSAVREKINEYRSRGYTVCFISDMYIDATVLFSVLMREGCIREGERVWVSCEYQARKDSGELFNIVKSEYSPRKWVHYGDNNWSDVKMARRAGARTCLVRSGYTKIEKSLLEHCREESNKFEYSLLIGSQRATRLRYATPAAEMAANYVAPTYIAYVRYCLEMARQRGIKRLYYLARDGYILEKIGDCIQKYQYKDIETRLLYVSRKSLFLASLIDCTVDELRLILDSGSMVGKTVDWLLTHLHLSRDILSEKFNIDFKFNKVISLKQEKILLTCLFTGACGEFLKKHAASARNRVLAYFKQEGLLNDVFCATIDVGWWGSTRLMMNRILRSVGANDTEAFYFAVRRDVIGLEWGRYYTFLHDGVAKGDITLLVEQYLSASPLLSTIDYADENNVIKPVFSSGSVPSNREIVTTNVMVSEELCRMCMEYERLNTVSCLYTMGIRSLNSLVLLENRLDLSPLAQVDVFNTEVAKNKDESLFVRSLTLVEAFKYAFLGARITGFDAASAEFTFGRYIGKFLSGCLHLYTGKLRKKLYKLIIKK